MDCLNLQIVDGRQIRIDWDPGFKFGRQFGRGKTGAQVRDEINQDQPDKDRPLSRQNYQQHQQSYRRGGGGNRGGSYQAGGFNSGSRGGGYKRGREFEGAEEMEFDENDRRKRQKRFEDQM